MRIAVGVCALAGLGLTPLGSHAQLQQPSQLQQQQQELVIHFVRNPDPAPELKAKDVDGKEISLDAYKGKVVLLNFWATWCGPCRREIPLLQGLRRQGAVAGLEVIGIAVDSRDAVLKYAHDMGIHYPILIGEQDGLKAVDAFGMQAVFPFSVFADRQGRIVALKIGELHADEAHLILTRLGDVEAGRLELSAAREQISAGLKTLAVERANKS